MKIYNILNGVFYVLYGLMGVISPLTMAGIMGWTPDLLGLHQLRAICMVMAALGGLVLLSSLILKDQKMITLILIFIILSFAAGRCLGLLLDGAGPMQTYYEIGFELFWAAMGGFLVRRTKSVAP